MRTRKIRRQPPAMWNANKTLTFSRTIAGMRRILFPITVLFVTLLGSANAVCWLNTGHRIVADVAWEELTPAARAWATDILKQHPRYEADLLLNKPDGIGDAE